MAVVGSVGVGVVPDARGWSEKLKAQILPGSDEVGRDLGQHIGNAAGLEARRHIEAQLHDLKATVNVDADTGKARAEVAALRNDLDKPVRGPGLLLTAIAGIGPALVPLAAVAAASFGALAEAGGVALLAIKGVQQQMEDGTQLGKAYAKNLDIVKDDFEKLSAVAAQGVFQGFTRSVASINGLMPQLAATTRLFAAALGEAGAHIVHGLAEGLVKLQPLMNDLLGFAVSLTAKFDTFASGGGLVKFGTWVQANLPAIENDIIQVAKALARLLEAGAGTGVSILNIIGALARAINAIPVPVLATLVPLLSTGLVVWKGYAVVTGIMTGVNTALEAYALKAAVAAGVSKELATANASAALGFGALGASLGALAVPLGVVTAAVAALTVEKHTANKPGLLGRITGLISDTGVTKVNPAFLPGGAQGGKAQTADTQKATAAQKAYAAALGTTADANLAAQKAVNQNAAALKKQTVEMQLQNDAAGLLSQALNKLGGNNLGVAEATDQNIVATKASTAAFKENGEVVSGNSAKALANRQALEQNAHAALNLYEAVAKQTGSTDKATKAFLNARDATIKDVDATLRAQGATQGQIAKVNDLIRSLYKIPARRKTAIDVATEAAQADLRRLKDLYDAIHDKNVTVTVGQQIIGPRGGTVDFGGHRAAGGRVLPGRVYEVGERGRELFESDVPGKIIPNGSVSKYEASAAQARGVTNYWTINQVDDPVGTANAVARRMDMAGRI